MQLFILNKFQRELPGFVEIDGARLSEWKQQLDKLEKDRKIWKTKVDQLEGLREKSKKENDAQILKWEKALEAAKKKYDSKKKHFESIDCDIQSREAMIADCATVCFSTL